MTLTSMQTHMAASTGTLDLAPITKLLGIRVVSWSPGEARLEMEVGPEHHNPASVVQGGIHCTLADAAMGAAFAVSLEEGDSLTSIDLHISFFRPVRNGLLSAIARVVRKGRRTGYLECEILDGSGEMVAKAVSTFMILQT